MALRATATAASTIASTQCQIPYLRPESIRAQNGPQKRHRYAHTCALEQQQLAYAVSNPALPIPAHSLELLPRSSFCALRALGFAPAASPEQAPKTEHTHTAIKHNHSNQHPHGLPTAPSIHPSHPLPPPAPPHARPTSHNKTGGNNPLYK